MFFFKCTLVVCTTYHHCEKSHDSNLRSWCFHVMNLTWVSAYTFFTRRNYAPRREGLGLSPWYGIRTASPRRCTRVCTVFPKLWFPRCSVNTRPRRRAFRALSHASSRRYVLTGCGIDFNFGFADFLPLRDNLAARRGEQPHARIIKANIVTNRSNHANHASCKTTAVPRAS